MPGNDTSQAPKEWKNRLLRHLGPDVAEELAGDLEPVDCKLHQMLADAGDPIRHVFFPEDCVVSLVGNLNDGASPELATIGREGLTGAVTAVGSQEAYSQWLVQVAGTALRCPATKFEAMFERNRKFRQVIVCYLDALLSQTLQSVACNALHPVEARCARWILMMDDRSDGDHVPLTQEFLGQMLAVHRSTVAITMSALQRAGYIETRRAMIRISDRSGLRNAACECYGLVRDRFERLLPGTFSP